MVTTRSGSELDPLSPLAPGNVQPSRQRRTSAPPPPPPPLRHPPLTGGRPQQQAPHASHTPKSSATEPNARARQSTGQARAPARDSHPRGRNATILRNIDESIPHDWVLNLHIRSSDGDSLAKIGVQVTNDMNTLMLSDCVGQACSSVYGISAIDTTPRMISGLFIEPNGIFVSLDHLLAMPSLRNQFFCLTYHPRAKPPPKKLPWY